jgi:hypothetical protein
MVGRSEAAAASFQRAFELDASLVTEYGRYLEE